MERGREKGLHVFDSGWPAMTGDLSRYIERDAARGQNVMLVVVVVVPRFRAGDSVRRRGRCIV